MSGIEVIQRGDGPPEGAVPKAGANNASASAQAPSPTLAVWAARLVTLAALAAIVGYLIYSIVTDTRPARFEIQPDFAEMEQRNGNYVLPVTIVNDSTEAVTQVVLDVSQTVPGQAEPTTFSLTFALMGEGETAKAELVFETPPSESNTTLRVSSYQSP